MGTMQSGRMGELLLGHACVTSQFPEASGEAFHVFAVAHQVAQRIANR
jgi:hypothetical protein